jgi:hypothetical protein
MQSVAFVAPMLPGKTETERQAMASAFQGLGSSEDTFDVWFRGHVLDVHGIDLAQGLPPPEQTVDFRR